MAHLVTLTELAQALGRSVNAMRDYIRGRPDFPIAERGKNGAAYKIDLDDATAYIQREEEQRQAEEAAKNAALGELAKMFGEEGDGRSADDLAKAIANRHRLNDLALKEGLLVPADEMSRDLTAVFDWFGRSLEELPARMQRDHGLSAAVVASMEENINNLRRMMHEKIVRIASSGVAPDADEPGLFEAAQ